MRFLKLKRVKNKYRTILILLLVSLVVSNCIDPVEPEFEYKEGLIFVEGFASTSQGASSVSIIESVIEFGVYGTSFIEGASVFFVNSVSGEIVPLSEQIGAYVPPEDFVVYVGETWEVEINFANGTQFKSEPETVISPVEIKDVSASYNPKLLFKEASGRFVPGHQVSISFDDPANEENFYYWSFRSYENLEFCEKCYSGIFRNGACEIDSYAPPPPKDQLFRAYNDYRCEESNCWKIRFPESINIFSDKVSDGISVNKLSVAEIPLYTKENMVVEIQQFSLSFSAHEYYKVLKDIIDNNGGFNAPPPAALIGNLYNSNNTEDFIFGRFTVASTTTAFIFIDRSEIEELPIEIQDPVQVEGCEVCPPGTCPAGDCAPVLMASCSETRYRTAIIPPEWIGN